MLIDYWIEEAIIRANKLGAKGYQVVAIKEPECATSDGKLTLVLTKPRIGNATDIPWYER